MSLTSFVSRPEVVARLKPLRPKLPRKIPAVLVVPPRTERFPLVGTAFDYLLRFELRRRAPHAVSYPWVAEHVPEMFLHDFTRPEIGAVGTILPPTGRDAVRMLAAGYPRDEIEAARGLRERARGIVEQAKDAVDGFALNRSPSADDFRFLARQALQLARLEAVFRCGRMFPRVFDEPDVEDVKDLLELLDIVPFENLVDPKTVLLNPHFEHSSGQVGGADADLIVGDMLVDVKTTKKPVMEADQLDALLGYLFLARYQSGLNPRWPRVSRLALYFSRHGCLWTLPAWNWTQCRGFGDVEKWFFDHAKTVFAKRASGPPSRG